jgi:hypothetical protein
VTDYSTQVDAANAPSNGTQYAGIVNLPTTYGTLLIRLLVLQNTTSDLSIIRAYQNASILTPINRATTKAPSPLEICSASLQTARFLASVLQTSF